MIKKAELHKEYFIVLLPQGEMVTKLQKIQKAISKKYNLYQKDNYPQLHVTLDRIKKECANEAIEATENIIQNFEPVEIKITDFTCLSSHINSLAIQVEKTQSLHDLADNIHYYLSQKNISTISDYNSWNFHITIASNLFAENPLPETKYKDICSALEGVQHPTQCFAKSIEIWRPTLDPEEKCVKSFKLNQP